MICRHATCWLRDSEENICASPTGVGNVGCTGDGTTSSFGHGLYESGGKRELGKE